MTTMSAEDLLKYAQKMIDLETELNNLKNKKTEYMRKYREANKEKFREYNRKNTLTYYHKHLSKAARQAEAQAQATQ